MKLKTKKLILDLMLAARGEPLAARDAVSACGLFGISENNVRVTLARLSADGLIRSAGRGLYALTDAAMDLGREVNAWRDAEQRLRPWRGDYVVALTAALGRSDRAALKRRQRALNLMGFRELEPGMHVRPNNIERDLDAVRARLHQLGLEGDAPVFGGGQFETAFEQRIRDLWGCERLNRNYREQVRTLTDWMQRWQDLEPDVAARESFLLGGEAIRLIVFDPLLPDAFVDRDARHRFIQTTKAFDDVGQRIWRGLEGGLAGMPAATHGQRAPH